jgi:hypothetical protein
LERDPTPSRFRRRAADADIYFTNPILFSSPLRFPNNKTAIVTDTGPLLQNVLQLLFLKEFRSNGWRRNGAAAGSLKV